MIDHIAQFIILLCILAYLHNNLSLKKQIFVWGGLIALSVSINMYFGPMVVFFMFFFLLREYITTRNIKNQCIVLGTSAFILIVTLFCFGGFHYFAKSVESVEGNYYLLSINSANLNTLINPHPFVANVRYMQPVIEGISSFIKEMPVATEGQYEGYAYLGLGIILLVAVVIFIDIQNGRSVIKAVKKQSALPSIGIVLAFLLLSLSPTITLNQNKLFTYPLIMPIVRLWSIFRSTGRMVWPLIYIITTFCIWRVIKQFSVKKSVLVLSIFLLVQWVDQKPWFVSKGNNFKNKTAWQSELSSPVWNDLAKKYKHILFMGDDHGIFMNYQYMSFVDLAANHKMTINYMFGRSNWEMVNGNKEKEGEYLIEYGPKNDMIYIFFQDVDRASLYKDTGIYFYVIDGVLIGLGDELALS
jgi:hypothetical protein